jgi:hypothetical protein
LVDLGWLVVVGLMELKWEVVNKCEIYCNAQLCYMFYGFMFESYIFVIIELIIIYLLEKF